MTSYDPAKYDALLGYPLCECGHAWSLHDGDGCRRAECIITGKRCAFYRPAEKVDPESPAAFARAVRAFVHHDLSPSAIGYDREQIAAQVEAVVAGIAQQWAGWKPKVQQ